MSALNFDHSILDAQKEIAKTLQGRFSAFTITGNPTIDLALVVIVATYLWKRFWMIYSIIKTKIEVILERKFYSVCEVTNSNAIEWIVLYMDKYVGNKDYFEVKHDRFSTKVKKFEIKPKTLKTGSLFMKFEGRYIRVIDQSNSLKLKILRPNKVVDWFFNWFVAEETTHKFVDAKTYFAAFVEKANEVYEKHLAENSADKRIKYFEFVNNSWQNKAGIPQRNRHSVFGSSVSRVIKHVEKFVADASFYAEHNLTYKTGILLYGPPGTGKTTIVKAVATEYQYPVYKITLSDMSMNDRTLSEAFSTIPEKSIVLLEDLDTAFIKGLDGNSSNINMVIGQNGVATQRECITYTGLLNVLDGIATAYGNIVFVTTNHVEKLGQSSIRAGRIDFAEYVGYVSKDDIRNYFDSFFKVHEKTEDGELDPVYAEIKDTVAEMIMAQYKNVTMAELQNYFVKHRNNYKDVLLHVSDFKANTTSKMVGGQDGESSDNKGDESAKGQDSTKGDESANADQEASVESSVESASADTADSHSTISFP